jgi:tRNA dimethylallyltransferase
MPESARSSSLEARAREQGWPALHARLAEVDPASAARLAPNDAQRIQRALEVFRLTGQPLSQLHQDSARRAGLQPDRFLSLEPVDRAWLHERIARRFDAMLAAGLLDEVRDLRARGDLHADLPSMRSVGYRQAWEALDGDWPLTPDSVRERGIAATRQLAKRQLTWLRAMPQRQVIACDAPDALSQVLRAVGVGA